ncbi:MAG: FAD-dependent monooxygenase [Pseudomonadota bacterium]
MRVLVAGGGIGGLTAALCFANRGAQVVVFEQAKAFTDVGAGLQLSPNAMKVLIWLGLGSAIEGAGFAPEFAEMRMGESGQTVFKFPLGDGKSSEKRWGAPYRHIHRADFVQVLHTALQQFDCVDLVNAEAADSYEQDGERLTLKLNSGRVEHGDCIVAADGIHSAIREHMLGPDQPRFTGNIAWRGIAPMEALGEMLPDPNATIWLGRGKHVVTYRLRGGTVANFVGVVETSNWYGEGWYEEGTRDDAFADFKGWHPIVRSLIEAAPQLFKWGLFDRPRLERWVDGRVALLGDAAHPMLPFMAQGAGQAIEDAFILAREVMEGGPTDEALKRYEGIRKPRATRVQDVSRGNATLFHHRSAARRFATYGPMWMAGKLAPRAIMAQQDWLYGYDPVA